MVRSVIHSLYGRVWSYFALLTLLWSVPVVSGAQGIQEEGGILDQVENLVDAVVPILIGIAVIYFIWGVIQYVVAKGAEDQKNAINTMVYGIIGLFVIVAVWGLVAVVDATFGNVTGQGGPTSPGIPGLDGTFDSSHPTQE